MLRGSRSTAALAASLLVLSGALSACGGEEAPGTGLDFADRLEAVSVEGEVGEAALAFESRMTATGREAETLVEGEGEALADGDTAYVNYALGNGYSRETAVDSFGEEAAALEITVGAEPNAQPASIDDIFRNLVQEYVTAGVTKGTRIAVTGDTRAFFPDAEATSLGQALAAEGIGNEDGLVMVIDVLDVAVLPGPDGPPAPAPAWAPAVEAGAAGVTGLDFAGLPKPTPKDKLLSAVLRKGTGATVEKGDLLLVDYLGQTYDATEPFDESYSAKKEPLATPIGLGSVIAGWDEVLVGQTVGSRVLMRVPPAKGYGTQEQPNIPARSTLYFVVDVLAAV